MGSPRITTSVAAQTFDPAGVSLAPYQRRRIVSIARRQGISASEVILRSLDVYEQQQEADAEDLISAMQTALDRSLASLREARHAVDESNRLILLYRQHPELLEKSAQ